MSIQLVDHPLSMIEYSISHKIIYPMYSVKRSIGANFKHSKLHS